MKEKNASAHNLPIKDKNILITGGTTGIGRATGLLLVSMGGNIMTFGRHEKELSDVKQDYKEIGKNVIGFTADTSKKEDLEMVFKRVDEEFGNLDVLINNAALGGGNLFEEKYDDWKYLIETNILGYLSFARYAADRMEKVGKGHIVNIGSMSADEREAESEVYVATKAGIQAFSESLRKALNTKGIKVTLIEPGAVGTDMQPQSPAEQKKLIEKEEMLMAEDIAQAILFTLTQPNRSDIVELQVRPHKQII